MNSSPIVLLDWLFILKGLGTTLFLCFCTMILGSALGIILGILRTSKIKVLSYLSWFYIYVIRGTPLLMQLFLIYYGLPILARYPISAFYTALIGLTLFSTANLAEIVKAGLLSVDIGQKEAAKSLGMNGIYEFVYIVFPQALKLIVPNSVGFFIALLKNSSLVSIIGFLDLTYSSKMIIARTFQPFTIYSVVALIYFVICYGLSKLSKKIERSLEVDYAR